MKIWNRRAWMRSAVATAACAVLALPLAAGAQTYRHRDPAHDVVLLDQLEDLVKVPANRSADITAARFRHTNNNVVAWIRLRHYAGGHWWWSEDIKTPHKVYGLWGEKFAGRRFRLSLYAPNGYDVVPCPGISTTIAASRNSIRVSVPNKCVDQPRWVRFRLLFGKTVDLGDYMDDPLQKGYDDVHLAVTPRIYRG